MLPDTLLEDAAEKAEQFRILIASYDFDEVERVTVSFGVVEYVSACS